MASDEEVIIALKQKHGTESVADSVEVRGIEKYVRIRGLPVRFAEAYDDAFGSGAHEQDLAREPA